MVLFTMMYGTIGVSAKYLSVATSWKGYNFAGITVIKETLHACGYYGEQGGKVTDKYLTTDKCFFPNQITDEKTWVEKTKSGNTAKGSFKTKVGIPSPWGVIGTSGTTHVLGLFFSK